MPSVATNAPDLWSADPQETNEATARLRQWDQQKELAPALSRMPSVVTNADETPKFATVQKRLLRKEKNKIEMDELRVLAMTPIIVDAVSETKDDFGLASDTPLGLQHVSHLLRVGKVKRLAQDKATK